MKKVLSIVAGCAMLSLASCSKERIKGSGTVSTESRNVSGFTTVYTAGSTNVHLSQGASFKVEVKGYSNLLPYYKTSLSNNELRLGFEPGVNVNNDNTEVYITLPVLEGLALSGSGNMYASGTFPATNQFNATVAGSGSIHFSTGSTTQFNSKITGSGHVYAMGMTAVNADTRVDGSGNTEITAGSSLKVTINGSGNVYYHGTPVITTQITGSGAVIPR